MSVVTEWLATPNRLQALFAYLGEREDGERLSQLEAIFSPPSLRRSKKTSIFQKVLSEARRLRIIAEDGEKIMLLDRPSTREIRTAGGIEACFRNRIEPLLLDPEQAEVRGQGGFAELLAWFLTTSPREPFPLNDAPSTRIRAEVAGADDAFEIKVREDFIQFAYWVRWLGYAVRVGSDTDEEDAPDEDEDQVDGTAPTAIRAATAYLIPDPTAALARHLPRIFAAQRRMRLADLLAAWAFPCPVLEGGIVRREIEARLAPEALRMSDRLSPATSLALARLQFRGAIRLSVASDADVLVLADEHAGGRASHIEYLGETS